MRDRLIEWTDPRFVLGAGLAIYETVLGDARLQVYGVALMLAAPWLASAGERILSGRPGNGNGSRGARD